MTNFFLKSLWAVWMLLVFNVICAAFCVVIGLVIAYWSWEFNLEVFLGVLRFGSMPAVIMWILYMINPDCFVEDSEEYVNKVRNYKK